MDMSQIDLIMNKMLNWETPRMNWFLLYALYSYWLKVLILICQGFNVEKVFELASGVTADHGYIWRFMHCFLISPLLAPSTLLNTLVMVAMRPPRSPPPPVPDPPIILAPDIWEEPETPSLQHNSYLFTMSLTFCTTLIDISKYSCSSSEVAGVLEQDNKCQSWKFYILHVCTLRVINFTQRNTKWIQNTNPFTAYLTHFTYLHQVYKQDNKGPGDKMGEHT